MLGRAVTLLEAAKSRLDKLDRIERKCFLSRRVRIVFIYAFLKSQR